MRDNKVLFVLVIVFVVASVVGYVLFKNGTMNTWLTRMANIAPAAKTTTTRVYTDSTTQGSESNRQADVPTTEAANSTDNVAAVGTYFNACTSVGLDDDITALKNNGQVVPNSFMFLDKNETEIAAGDYWFIDVPAFVYGHIFYPVTGLTYQVRGPAKLMVGAATFWCDNGGSTPHNGMFQLVDAKRLDEMLLDSNWELTGDGAIGDWVTVPSVEAQPK